jgi:hypothetical protein
MPKSLRLLAIAGLACLGAAAAVADGSHGLPGNQRPPSGVIHVSAGGERLTVWPYTTDDLRTPSDPVNLVFLNADPRAIRQELLKLDGDRTGSPFAALPMGDCTWEDGMGNEQAAFGRPERWVGGAIQLVCVHHGFPLGDPAVPFRYHVRLFRIGAHTLGGAHFELLIPGTAEHEALSWDLARELVAYDLGPGRAGAVIVPPELVGLIPGGYFRAVRRPIYDGLTGPSSPPGLMYFLETVLRLVPPDATSDVPIPTSGEARAFITDIEFAPARTHEVTTTQVDYGVDVPKPFCATGPGDFVHLGGRLQFTLSVSTLPSGHYERTHTIGGTLRVTPLGPGAGPAADASIFELHRAWIGDRRAQATEQAQQSLLGDPFQTKAWSFAAGDVDRFLEKVVCGVE